MPEDPDIGAIGEAQVHIWAKQAKITPNPAKHDKTGFDTLLQFPTIEVASASLDASPPALSCLVQIKTKVSTRRSCSIKLSNWKRLVDAPIPAFYVIVDVDDRSVPVGAYLVHIDEEWIAKVLRKLRSLPSTDAGKLHKRTFALTWGDENALPTLHGSSLAAAIRGHIGQDLQKYVLRKIRTAQTIGYASDAIRMTMKIAAPSKDALYAKMADLAIGLVPRLEVGDAEVEEVRFGIAKPSTKFSNVKTAAYMELPQRKPDGQVRLGVLDGAGRELASIQCAAYYASAVFPFLPKRHRKVRFVGGSISCVVAPGPKMLSLAWHFELPVPGARTKLREAVSAAKVARIFAKGGEHRLLIEAPDRRFEAPVFSADGPPNAKALWYAELIEHAGTLMDVHGLPPDLEADPQDLIDHADAIRRLSFGSRPETTGEWTVGMTVKGTVEQTDGRRAASLFARCPTIGTYTLMVGVAVVGTTRWHTEGGKVRMSIEKGTPRIMFSKVLSHPVRRMPSIERLLREARKVLDGEGIQVITIE